MEERRRRILERQRQKSQGLRDTLSMIHLSIMAFNLIIACGGAYLITGNISSTESFGLVIGGAILALISFFGWFGTLHEHVGYLQTYCGIVGLMVFAQWFGLGWLYFENQHEGWWKLDQRISKVWDFFMAHDGQVLMDIEQLFHCCGYNSTQDRAVPMTCQKGLQGCKVIGLHLAEQWQWTLVIGFVLLMMIQVIKKTSNFILNLGIYTNI
ncbi:hypothetical protein BC941DRAFT_425000 [Chlamydoabsidia padenii]|nr:hypothetical protein BC941DRAFT_425000 [Chlamydoabsidia padenii]